MVRDSISLLIANNDERRNGSSGFYIPRYKEGPSVGGNVSQLEIANMDAHDIFDLGEVPMHLIREYKATYSQ